MIDKEFCTICGSETGRAGAADDSLFICLEHAEVGPLCEECFGGLRRDDLIDELARCQSRCQVIGESLRIIDRNIGDVEEFSLLARHQLRFFAEMSRHTIKVALRGANHAKDNSEKGL